MTQLQQLFLCCGALLGFFGLAAGAFGAHLLKSKLSSGSFEVFEVAVRYQMYHALALIALVVLLGFIPSFWLLLSGWLFVAGILVFSGSLYLLVFTEIRSFGAITPIGGVLLLFGWLSLAISAIFNS